jgi:hypothetical protein
VPNDEMEVDGADEPASRNKYKDQLVRKRACSSSLLCFSKALWNVWDYEKDTK